MRAAGSGWWENQSLAAATTVPLTALRPADTPRSGELDLRHVHKLAAARDIQPIIVHRPTMRVIDGMHRVRAAALMGHHEIGVRFFDGSEADAFVIAVRANGSQGLPLSRAERLAAARRIVISHPDWSDRAVSAAAGLSPKTVREIRRRASGEVPQSSTRLGLDGRVRPVHGASGRARAAAFIREHPTASLRAIAEAAGVSTGTARDVRIRLENQEDPVLPRRLGRATGVSARRPGAAAPERRTPAETLAVLRKDPSLRSTDSGRLLLRLLDTRALSEAHRRRIIADIPPHVRSAVSAAARQCQEIWNEFSQELESTRPDNAPNRVRH